MKFIQSLVCAVIWITQRVASGRVHVLGKTYFISKGVFNPKYYKTSIFMAEHIKVKPDDRVLDIGTGSGIQAVVAAQKSRHVVATDINPEAVKYAKKNIKENGLEKRVKVLQGDLFTPIKKGSKFDVILFTPPYLEGKPKDGFSHALYDPGKRLVKRFFKQAEKYLKKGGYIQMVYSSIADIYAVLKIAKSAGWRPKLVAKKSVLGERFFVYKFKRS
jgi:release factor glutamine methyltransferase